MNDQGKFPPLPKYIADQFKRLSTDLSLVSAHWILYKQLFAHSEKRCKLLGRAAPAFFEFLFHTLRDEVFMALCRFADPPTTLGKENLSFDQVMSILQKEELDENMRKELRAKLASFKEQCEPLKPHRDKRLAHRDLLVSVASSEGLFPGVTIHMVDDALATASDYLNTIEKHFSDSSTAYEYFVMLGDADTLVYHLAEAMRYEELKRSGTVKFDDLDKSEWHNA